MNQALTWFGRLTWVGIAVNLAFALGALFAPDLLQTLLGAGTTEFSYIWLGNAGMLLVQLAIFYMPLARRPETYAVYAWLTVAAHVSSGLFWGWQGAKWQLVGPVRAVVFVELAFALVLAVLLHRGLPAGYRLSDLGKGLAGLFDKLADTLRGTEGNAALTWFSRLTLVGFAANLLTFALPALFAPEWLTSQLQSVAVSANYVWIAYAGLLLLIASCFYLPAAHDPLKYHVYAWLSVVGRLIACTFWIWIDVRWQPTGPVRGFFLADGFFGLCFLVLLHKGMPEPYRLSAANLGRAFSSMAGHVGDALRSPVAVALILLLLLGGGLVAYELYDTLGRSEPDTVFDDPAEQFKYGAIGLSMANRIPLYLWEVIPEICPDLLPEHARGGSVEEAWASFGLLYEPGQKLPIGFAKRQIGYPSVEPNCALCHTASYRTAEDAERAFILGGPAHELDLEGFQWFLYDCAASDAFTADAALEKIKENHDLGWIEGLLYRVAIVPFAKVGLEQQQREYGWQKSRPTQGRGRTDTFNPTKIVVFHLADDGTIGTVDLPAIWNQRPRKGLWLHWDGNNDAIRERNYAAAMAIGATPYSVLEDHFQMVTDFVLDLPPPKFPYPVDEERAERGWGLYGQHCADCHAFGSEKVGKVTDIEEIGTDRHRLDSFTQGLVDRFHEVDEGPFKFDAYRKTQGYSNLPIDGTWARAPYLHNGSVPTLWQLLTPEERPASFYKGYDVYDPEQMGFVHSGPGAEKVGFLLETSTDGNGNGGHTYGSELSEEEKRDLIEYLKTL